MTNKQDKIVSVEFMEAILVAQIIRLARKLRDARKNAGETEPGDCIQEAIEIVANQRKEILRRLEKAGLLKKE